MRDWLMLIGLAVAATGHMVSAFVSQSAEYAILALGIAVATFTLAWPDNHWSPPIATLAFATTLYPTGRAVLQRLAGGDLGNDFGAFLLLLLAVAVGTTVAGLAWERGVWPNRLFTVTFLCGAGAGLWWLIADAPGGYTNFLVADGLVFVGYTLAAIGPTRLGRARSSQKPAAHS